MSLWLHTELVINQIFQEIHHPSSLFLKHFCTLLTSRGEKKKKCSTVNRALIKLLRCSSANTLSKVSILLRSLMFLNCFGPKRKPSSFTFYLLFVLSQFPNAAHILCCLLEMCFVFSVPPPKRCLEMLWHSVLLCALQNYYRAASFLQGRQHPTDCWSTELFLLNWDLLIIVLLIQ